MAPRVSVMPRLRVTAFPSLLDDSGLPPRMLHGATRDRGAMGILIPVGR